MEMISNDKKKLFWQQFLQEYEDCNNLNLKGIDNLPSDRRRMKSKLPLSIPSAYLSNFIKNGEGRHSKMFVSLIVFSSILFERYLEIHKCVLNTPTFGSTKNGHQNNTIPVFIKHDTNQTLREAFIFTQSKLQEFYQNQDYQFREMDGSKTNSPFKSNVLLINEAIHSSFDEAEFEHFDLILIMKESGSTFELEILYSDLYDGAFMQRLGGHFLNLFSQLNDISIQISEIDIFTNDERNELLNELSLTEASKVDEGTLHSLFEKNVLLHPDRIAITFKDQVITYKHLDEKANCVAQYILDNFNTQPKEAIAVLTDRSDLMIIAILAILKSGRSYLPIDAQYPRNRVQFVLSDADIGLILTTSDFMFDLDGFEGNLIALDVQMPNFEPASGQLSIESNPSDPAYIIYTSGSTGRPKGVVVSHGAIVNMVLDQIRQFGITEKDIVLQFASLSFDASVYEIFMAMASGSSLSLIEQETIGQVDNFIHHIRQKGVTVATLPPVYLSTVKPSNLTTLKTIITAGEEAFPVDAQECLKFSKYINAYGPSESAVCATVYKASNENIVEGHVPIGRPISNLQVYILDKKMRLVPKGVSGEICLAGVGLASGYLNRVDLTHERFVNHPFIEGKKLYRTGDMGRFLEDGNIVFLGRQDSQVKLRGYRIELGEIEHALKKHQDISNAIVLVSSESKSKQLAAYIVASKRLEIDDLRNYLGQQLPDYMTPHRFVFVDEFPITSNGKVDRKSLPELALQFSQSSPYNPPTNPTEEALEKIWNEVLSKEKISINDNFFTLGGDSLLAIKAFSQINEVFPDVIKISDLFLYESIKSMAEFIQISDPTIARHSTGLEYNKVSL